MPVAWDVPLGLVAILAIVCVIAYRTTAGTHSPKPAAKLAKRFGLPLEPEIIPLVRSIWRRQVRGALAGGLIGSVFGALIVITLGGTDEPVDAYWVMGGFLAGGAIGSSASALTGELRRNPPAIRIARSRAVTLSDFVPRSQLIAARVVVGLTATSTILGLTFGVRLLWSAHTVVTRALPLAMTILCVSLLIVFEISGRRLIQRSRQVGSELELSWDDAFRGSTLQQMISAPTYLAIYPVFVTLETKASLEDVGWQATLTGTIFLAYLATLVIMLLTSPEQQFLRRLWPAVGEEQRRLALEEWTRASLDLQASNAARDAEKWARRHPSSKIGNL